MSARLAGIQLKVERADKHICELHALLTEFVNKNPYRVSPEIDPDSGDKVIRVRASVPFPQEWAVIAGDIAHNVRSALDHLMWQLIEAAGGTPDERTYFPICESEAKYKDAVKSLKKKGLADAAVSRLDRLKPYEGGNVGLWLLHRTNIHDKHRLLLGGTSTFSEVRVQSPVGGRFVADTRRWTVLEDGTEIGRYPAPFDESYDVDLKLSYQIAFVEPPVVRGRPVTEFLWQCTDLVRRIAEHFADEL